MKNVKELMTLQGRTALITGGAGHIGSTFAGALAELGASLVLVDINLERCSQVAKEIETTYKTQVLPIAVDISDESALRSNVGSAIDLLGRLDILIHCAAWVGTTNTSGWAVPFSEQSTEAWEQAFRVNLTSGFILAQHLQPWLARSGHGSIIFVSSIYGLVGPDLRLYEGSSMVTPAGYAASKGGILQLTRYLATVMAPNIRVNAITPGGVWRGQPESFHERYKMRTPLGRMAVEEDLIGAGIYLASDLSSYVTGQNLIVDGGWTAW